MNNLPEKQPFPVSNPQFCDLTGQTFGRLEVLYYVGRTHNGRPSWACVCACGTRLVVMRQALRNGDTTSCGCYKTEITRKRWTTHNASHTPLYRCWRAMLARCHNSQNPQYPDYGGRGISVCDRWRNSFESFRDDVGDRPGPRYSLDRYPNNDGNYEPGNVRWATTGEQARNKRSNVLIELNGKKQTLQDWAKETGLAATTISMRLLKGMSVAEALAPARQRPTKSPRVRTPRPVSQPSAPPAVRAAMPPPVPVSTDPRFIDFTGREQGRIKVLYYTGVDKNRQSVWVCDCACGRRYLTTGSSLRSGAKSCGCYKNEASAARCRTHGLSHTKEFRCWHQMIQRCTNKNIKNYPDYGGRGIKVCDRWLHSFEAFYQDVGPRPGPRYSLDRFPDNNGNYEPGNVRWATTHEQSVNKRNTRLLEFQGVTRSVSEWARRTGLSASAIEYRLLTGMSVAEALTAPKRRPGPSRPASIIEAWPAP